MLGKTHALIGCGVGLALAHVSGFEPIQMLASGAGGAVVALLPDVDHPNSTVSHKLGLLALPFRLLPHRTWTHALWIPLIFGGLYLHYGLYWVAVAGLAWASHILADMITPRGVPLLYPVWRGRMALPLVRTGGLAETLIFLGLLVSMIVLLYEALIM